MTKTLNILAPTRYPWRFNGPRASQHNVENRLFVPFNKFSYKIEGITLFNPFPLKRFDLVHAFNRIPLGQTPFIIGFESHLPRAYGLQGSTYFALLSKYLASPHCRGIIAISEYGKRHFLSQHKNKPWRGALEAKLSVRYPNFSTPSAADAFTWDDKAPIRVVFVGNHFGRKGGSVALRVAELAQQNNIPFHLDVISTLEVGGTSWIGPTRDGYWQDELKRLSLPNVTHHNNLPNAEVLNLVKKAHFSLLPTFADTFGFSVIESMANHTPVIATKQGALPEFMQDGVNSLMLDLDTDGLMDWKHGGRSDRHTQDYENVFHSTTEQLAQNAYAALAAVMKSPARYMEMRANARRTAETHFSDVQANQFWDDYYLNAYLNKPAVRK